jgi:hypothetical protein
MALTIHYQFGFSGSEAQLLDKLKWLSLEFLKLPVSKVGEIGIGGRGYELHVDVGPGCEWFTISLHQDEKDEWRGRGFTVRLQTCLDRMYLKLRDTISISKSFLICDISISDN